MVATLIFGSEIGIGKKPAGGRWKLSSDKREVFFLFIAIYCLISTQTYCNQRFKSAGHKFL